MIDHLTLDDRYSNLEPIVRQFTIPDRDSLLSMAVSIKRIADVLEDAFGSNTREQERRDTADNVHNIIVALQSIGGMK